MEKLVLASKRNYKTSLRFFSLNLKRFWSNNLADIALILNFQNVSVYVPFSGSSITIKNWENINMKRLNTKKKRKKNAKKIMVLISAIIGFWAKRRQQIPSTLTPWWHEDELSPSLVPYQLDRQNFSTLHRHSLPELQSGLPKR